MKDLSLKKLYYSISEVSKLTSVEQYILRYWETEFDELRPQKNRAGNRIYTNKDIDLILKIKTLLREKKYTIEGAKRILNDPQAEEIISKSSNLKVNKDLDSKPEVEIKKNLDNDILRKDLIEIKKLLEEIYHKL